MPQTLGCWAVAEPHLGWKPGQAVVAVQDMDHAPDVPVDIPPASYCYTILLHIRSPRQMPSGFGSSGRPPQCGKVVL